MYKKVEPNLDFAAREKRITQLWRQRDIFNKSLKDAPESFSFYDGPPTANGKPHIGHIITRVFKDIIPRYQTMKGKRVLRKAGWDTHGLPVELEVEKTLGIANKRGIEQYGIEPFICKCKESVFKYQKQWEEMSQQIGYWVDMERPYVTYDDSYIESVWWSLKTIFEKGLIYKGHKVVPYCPRCGTALSSHEVAQGYKDVEERSAVVKFKVKNAQNTFILAWTTTPWTLPSNVALCFNPNFEYATVQTPEGEKYILAKELIDKHFEQYTILEVKKGSLYSGTEYEPLFTFCSDKLKSHYVVCDAYVTLEDGTGVVHIAPAFGEDDARVGRNYNLPFFQAVDEQGKFNQSCGFLTELFCKDADALIIKDLKMRGLLKAAPLYAHKYPFCWRCDTPLLYYARATWFIKTTAVKDKLIKNNASVNWLPPSVGSGRMGNFLENIIDWGLSRERYWGTPLPLWVCDKCGRIHAVGSREELNKLSGCGDIELHKPHVDKITFECGCGGVMRRTSEVIDCWYDSGSMPFAQYHYPFENKDIFESVFPADFISEAVDQTRGWFYTLLVISTLLFDKAPFKNCIVLGHVNDAEGQKMSKHKGNVVDPFPILGEQGADAVRWYFYTNSLPYLPTRFYKDAVVDAQRKYLGTLYNTYAFYVLYADIDSFNPFDYKLNKCALTLMDKWALCELNILTDFVDKSLSDYKITEAARAIGEFTDKLSNWYVRRCRDRFWAGDMSPDKIAAFMTLFTVLNRLALLTAPFTPFIAEDIYQNIVLSVNPQAPESVHLCDFPKADKKYIDQKLSLDMQGVIKAAELGRAARAKANIKNRQPLSIIKVAGEFNTEYSQILCEELNVKEVEVVKDLEDCASYIVKPQLKTLGPKYGKHLNAIREYLSQNAQYAAECAGTGKVFEVTLEGMEITFTPDDLLVEKCSKQGYVTEGNATFSVALDTTVTEQLKEEGYTRELISKLQNLRKESGFEVSDRISIEYNGSEAIQTVFAKYGDRIAAATLATKVIYNKTLEGQDYDINGEKAVLKVIKNA